MQQLHTKLFILVLTLLSMSDAMTQTNQISAPVTALFDAMREGDGEKMQAQFTASAILQRAQPDGTIKITEIADFVKSVASSMSYLDEKLLAVEVNSSGNLASVWTPFAFYVDSKLSHCGVNSFLLINTANGWKINYIIDNAYQGDCNEFIKSYEK